jgi:hypothetical protein
VKPQPPLVRALVALLVLAGWGAPGARALGVGLHVALDQHHAWNGRSAPGEPGAAHDRRPGDPLESRHALDHPSHRHELEAPEPGPDAVRPSGVVVEQGPHGGCAREVAGPPLTALDDPFRSPATPEHRRRGSPVPLIYAHCSLLR